MCPRNYRGLDYNSGYPVTELTLSQFQQIFTPKFLKQLQPTSNNKQGVSFNGNLGDFGLARDGLEIVKYLVSHGVTVEINTNGSMRTPEWWSQLALPGVSVGFAIDGLEDTHHLYRQDTDWHKVIQNALAFISAGGHALWRFIPFDHNRHQESACRELSKQYGFAEFENIYDGRDTGPVFTRTGEFSHQIGLDSNPATNIKPLLESHISWYDAKTVKISRDSTELNIGCFHKRNQEIYIAADGSVYPCCYLGFYPGKMQHPGNQELAKLVSENNALEYPLEHCLNWFNQVEETWKLNSIAEGRTYQCVATCNRP
jgi:sulfatase maturation enzyme AslB (radical SAM superfamily)